MLSPDYLLHISEGAEEIAEQLHSEIIKRIVSRIMLRIGRGEEYLLSAADKWQLLTLQQAGYLLEEIQEEIAKATKKQQKEIAEAMEDAGVKALDYDDEIYRDVGLSPVPLTQSPELVRLMQRNYEATMGEWENFTRTTANRSQNIFLEELDKAYNLVSTGSLSYTQAVKEAVDKIVSDGVTVTYPTGHTDTVETATLRAVRTGISQATAQIQTQRMDEMDVDLVITSSHLGARPTHQVWQGKVFSRSGNSDKYPDFVQSTGYGTVTGLCGANCRHSFSPFFEGMKNPFEQYDSEENRKQYEKEQRQRVLERRIRKTKREVMGLKESVDMCTDESLKFELDLEYQKKASLLQKQNSEYQKDCEQNNLRPLSDRIQIAKWDRKQAAAARGAANRHENAKTSTQSVADSNDISYNKYRKNRNIQIGLKEYTEPMQLRHVKSVLSDMGIDFEKAKIHIIRDVELAGTGYYGWTNPNMKEIQLYPDAFISREELVKTLGHERVHFEQLKLFGPAKNNEELLYLEKGPRFSEEYWWAEYLRKANRDGKSN